MKNPLTFPIILLMASLALLVMAILMTPEVEVFQDPAFDTIVEQAGGPRPTATTPASTPVPEPPAAESAEAAPVTETLAADAP